MSFGKKIIASLAAFTIAVSASGCGTGKGTAWSARYEDYETTAGMFIYYEMSAYYQATNKAKEADENLDTTDKKALKAAVIDGKDMLTWIQDEATDSLRKYLAVQAEFDNRGLELTPEQVDEIKASSDSAWEYYGEYYQMNGIGKETFLKITELSYKSEMLFKSYYGEDGTDEVSVDEMKDFYKDNYARVKYITLGLKDSEGNELDDDAKAERKKMAEEFVERANKGEDFNKLIDEYNDYLEKLAEEAESEEEPEESEEITEETTAETTEAAESDAENSETEAPETEESALDLEEVTVTEAEAANDENDESEETSEETTAETEAEISEESEEVSETEELAETEESEETEETTESDEDETEAEDEDKDENPYENERIIKKGEDGSYTPSEKVNNAIFDAELGKAFFVDDSEENSSYYVVVRYDITERDDLFEGDAVMSILQEMMGDDYDEKLLAIVTLENINKNQAAYKRYNPFDFEI